MWNIVLGLLASIALVSGQSGDLFTFEEVKATLDRGGVVVLDVDGSECTSSLPVPQDGHTYISMPFRDWSFWRTDDGDFIRARDYYVQPSDPETLAMATTTRTAVVRPDNTVTFQFASEVTSTGEVFQLEYQCVLGRSARAFEWSKGLEIDNFYNYQEVKAALLLGRHVEAVMFGQACESIDWLPSGSQVHYGHRIVNFGVFNDATPDEFLVFYHSNLDANGGEPYETSWVAVGYALYPNGTVSVPIGIFQGPDWTNQWDSPPAVCETGVSMQFTAFRERDMSYLTYAQVREATLKGHDMELIAFTEFCDVISGVEVPNALIGHRFDQFQLFEAGDIWGPLEHITFSAFAIAYSGLTIIDEIKVYEDNRVVFDWFRWSADQGETRGELSCPLGSASLFHSISRERGPDFSYTQIMSAIKNEGAVFEMEVRYDQCDRSGNPIDLESTYGGIMWETYIIEDENHVETLFAAPLFSPQSNNQDDSGTGLWSTAMVLVYPDSTVLIYPRAYNWMGTDVTPFPSPDPIVCKLNTGGLDGSVYFFRYP